MNKQQFSWWVWGTATLVAAVTVAVVGQRNGIHTTPGSDVAYLFWWSEAMVVRREPIWHGYFSNVPLNHPGPIPFWVIGTGITFSAAFNVDHQTAVMVAWAAVCYLCVAAAAVFCARAFRTLYAGAGVVASYTAMNVYGPEWRFDDHGLGFYLWPVYGPVLAAHLTLAACAATVAVVARWRPGVFWAALFGGLALQSYVEIAAFGGVIIVVAAIYAVRWSKQDAAVNGRRWWTQPIWWSAIVGWIAGFWPFLIRMATEGVDLPIRYIVEIIDTQQRVAVGGNPWPTYFAWAWGVPPHAAWIVAATMSALVMVLCLHRQLRQHRAAGVTLGIIVVVGIGYGLVATGANRPQISPVAALVPLTFGPAAGLVGDRIRRWRNSSNERPTAPQAATVAIAVAVSVAAVGGSALIHSGLEQPRAATMGVTEPYVVAAVIEHVAEPGDIVALWTSVGHPYTSGLHWDHVWELM